MKRIIGIVCVLIGLSFTVSFLSVKSAGSENDISLQIRDSGLIASDCDSDEDDITEEDSESAEPEPVINVSVKASKDSIALTDNTYVIEPVFSEDGVPNEIVSTDEFQYDGSSMWTSAELANIRNFPSTDSEVITTVSAGTHVLRVSYGNDWSTVRLDDGTEGYILTSLINGNEPTATPTPTPVSEATPTPAPTSVPTAVPAAETTAGTTAPAQTDVAVNETPYSATVYASCALNVRSGPDISYGLVTVLSYGATINVISQTDNGWYRTADGYYVKCSLCSNEPMPVIDTGTNTDSSSGSGAAGTDLYSYCAQFIGTPYVFGGSTPSGFDCSGFVLYVMSNYYGVSLPHSAASISYLGSEVSASEIQAGDIVCYDYNDDGYVDHCAVYVGGGTIIHASNSRQNVKSSGFSTDHVTTIRRFI